MHSLLAVADTSSNSALITFAIYIAVVMFLAWCSGRVLKKRNFLSEYFLGSRSLGMWAFAMTFAATSASGGSFIGFPSKVYTHGWVVALWIAGYMIVPLVAMGLLGKRINQLARKSGAITIPDLLRDRFESKAMGMLSIVVIVFFLSFNLVSQFKGGSIILQTLLADVSPYQDAVAGVARLTHGIPMLGSADPGYLICLTVFTLAVVIYTTYGGFRAVVWTDVMQGFVMVAGVAVMLPLAIWMAGGLQSTTEDMSRMTPPNGVKLTLSAAENASQDLTIPKGTWLIRRQSDDAPKARYFRTLAHASIAKGKSATEPLEAIELFLTPSQLENVPSQQASEFNHLTVTVVSVSEPEYGADQPGVYVTAPGPSASDQLGFLPLSLAVSFFFMWTFSSAGQPSNMVRLMAFRDSRTLSRAMITVAIYYSVIYFPLVIIFCCARVVLPGWEGQSDHIMPEMASAISFAIEMPWLAGLLVAAPFAAVMSTLDSFLLMISSAVVRDVYQRQINPNASEKSIKRLTYLDTLSVGTAAMIAAINPPQFLQDIIIFTGTGLSTAFLAPVALLLYWPRMNHYGGIAGMLAGVGLHTCCYVAGYFLYDKIEPFYPGGFHPFVVGTAVSLVATIVVSLVTSPPPRHLVQKYFGVSR